MAQPEWTTFWAISVTNRLPVLTTESKMGPVETQISCNSEGYQQTWTNTRLWEIRRAEEASKPFLPCWSLLFCSCGTGQDTRLSRFPKGSIFLNGEMMAERTRWIYPEGEKLRLNYPQVFVLPIQTTNRTFNCPRLCGNPEIWTGNGPESFMRSWREEANKCINTSTAGATETRKDTKRFSSGKGLKYNLIQCIYSHTFKKPEKIQTSAWVLKGKRTNQQKGGVLIHIKSRVQIVNTAAKQATR